MSDSPCIAACLTASGRSAVAVIGVDGVDWTHGIDWFVPATEVAWKLGQIRYGSWNSSHGSESVVVTPTGPKQFEIHCHGGSAAVNAILQSLADSGTTIVDGFHWRRHVTKDRSILIVEAEEVLTKCLSVDDAAIVLTQTRGALANWCHHWIDRIERIRQFEASEPILAELRMSAHEIANHWSYAQKISQSRRVVLIGPPNVGKSSLVNRIAGVQRSIVHDVAGTTRDVLNDDTVIAGVPITLTDTAGIRVAEGEIEKEGIRRGCEAVSAADLVVLVLEPTTMDRAGEMIRDIGQLTNSPIMKVCNKSDLYDRPMDCEGDDEWIWTSALDPPSVGHGDDGIESWTKAMADALNQNRPPRGVPVPVTQRQADSLREIEKSSSLLEAASNLKSLLWGVC